MNLIRFCNNLFKEDGFVLIDAYSKEYIIGKPINKNPIKISRFCRKLSL